MKFSRSRLAHAPGPTGIKTRKSPPPKEQQANGTAIDARKLPKLDFLGLPLFERVDKMKARLDRIEVGLNALEARQRCMELELDILSKSVLKPWDGGLKADRKRG